MRQKRWIRHILYWVVFFSISLFNELYISPNFNTSSEFNVFLKMIISLLCIYSVKVVVVYTFLYYLIPLWEKDRKSLRFYSESIIILLIGTLCIRLITQYIIWPHIMNFDRHELKTIHIIARYFYSLLDLLQITGLAVAIKLFYLRIRQLQKEKELIREKLNAELYHIKSQTNPHFLFNALNSIYSLSRKKSDHAPVVALQLSNILRYMLYETEAEFLPVSKEISVLEQYISIQNTRFSSEHLLSFEQKIDKDDTAFPPLISFPIVENCFKHGDVTQAIKIEFHLNGNEFFLKTENYIREQNSEISTSSGLGLRNLRRQLELMFETFSLDYFKEENKFFVLLKIDLSTHANSKMYNHRR